MRHLHRKETCSARAEFATPDDFCSLFLREMKPLYRLAFLLTASHQVAEQCFVATIQEGSEQDGVFKDWIETWMKHSIIKKAIQSIRPESARGNEGQECWYGGQGELETNMIEGITRLPALERFAFVLSMLEGYSIRKCSTLLNCSTERVIHARTAASLQLSLLHSVSMRDLGKPAHESNAASHISGMSTREENGGAVHLSYDSIASFLPSPQVA
jgi:DNA-directed RNA polymerase specialized sigma24 family protein